MKKLTPSERLVIERLIFPESFEVIMEETQMDYGALRDDLMNLVNFKFVEVFNPEDIDTGLAFYDSDNIHEFTFRATKTGLKSIRRTA